jgi:hypothetical protein
MASAPSQVLPRRFRLGVPLLLVAALLSAGIARATEESETITVLDPYRHTAQERPLVFTADPTTPSAGVASVGYAFGLGSGVAADRPLPVNMASASGSHTVTANYGLTSRLAPFVAASFADVGTTTSTSSLTAGLAWQLTSPGAPLRASVSAAGVHEGNGGANGVSALAAASLDLGRLRVVGNLRADRLFAAGRDRLDTFLMAGATARIAPGLRAGVEYVGQDLEGMFAADAEGGARHAVGPTVALDLDGGRYQLGVGAGFGVGPRSPTAIVRGLFAFNL